MVSAKLLPLATLLQDTSLRAISHHVAAAKEATTLGFDAEAVCHWVADYLKLCKNLFKAYKPTSEEGLVDAAINEGIGRAKTAKKAFDVLHGSGTPQPVLDGAEE